MVKELRDAKRRETEDAGHSGGENRNQRGPDSLEAVIRAENQPDSLPVMTIGDADRVLEDRLYAEKVAERLLDYLMRIDELRGTGRLYVP